MKKIKNLLDMIKYIISSMFFSNINEKWIIGERLGESASDNGFYFFKYLMERQPDNDKYYFVYRDDMLLSSDLAKYRKNCIKLNSLKHFILYNKCKYVIVSHGARDGVPNLIYYKFKSKIKPIVYLQHGVVKFKKIHFTKLSYNKNIVRFLVSNSDEQNIICNQMMSKKDEHNYNFNLFKLKSYELMDKNLSKEFSYLKEYVDLYNYSESTMDKLSEIKKRIGFPIGSVPITGLARHDNLIEGHNSHESSGKYILVFPTWRDKLKNASEVDFKDSDFYKNYNELITDDCLRENLEANGYKIKFHLHPEMLKFMPLFKHSKKHVDFVCGNISKMILDSEFLITDYSSLAWDFKVLNKDIIFYHFDKDDFNVSRKGYCNSDEDWPGDVCHDFFELRNSILSNLNKYTHNIIPHDANNGFCQRIFNEINSIPKKVYFMVYNIYGIGGTVKTVTNTANYLYAKGVPVEIISVRRTKFNPDLGLDPGIKISVLFDARQKGTKYKFKNNSIIKGLKGIPVRLLSRFSSYLIHKEEDLFTMFSLFTDLQIIRKLRSLKDCILVTTIPSFNIIAPKYTNDSVKIVGQEHKFFDAHNGSLQKCVVESYPRLHHLTVLTDDDLSKYKNFMEPNRLSVQPNGTELLQEIDDFNCDNQKRFITLARFVEQKRLDLLLESFKVVVNNDPECKLDIFGHGPLKPELEMMILKLGLQHNVFIFEPVTDVYSVLPNYSAFLLSSGFEPFGMVIIEAYACGVPVISFDIDYGPKTLIKNEITGLKSQAFDIEMFANSVLKLASDPILRMKLSKNCLQEVSQNYSTDAVGDRFIQTLNNLSCG
ncbi:glycosyltransferase [Vibrio gangliei]|uniref:glycosyltransferase n=1 Tax=Vibrio gangliei TaxID=2077090 RepID=UPI000D012CE7|nr:glycosyltransferase [Vibrio gangliei]